MQCSLYSLLAFTFHYFSLEEKNVDLRPLEGNHWTCCSGKAYQTAGTCTVSDIMIHISRYVNNVLARLVYVLAWRSYYCHASMYARFLNTVWVWYHRGYRQVYQYRKYADMQISISGFHNTVWIGYRRADIGFISDFSSREAKTRMAHMRESLHWHAAVNVPFDITANSSMKY